MTTIYIEPDREAKEVFQLVRSAIESEIARLELALSLAAKQLIPFEQKYQVTSEQFIAEMAAEDLAGGDEEYVRWAGEYRLMQRLQRKLHQLQAVTFNDPDLFHPDQNAS